MLPSRQIYMCVIYYNTYTVLLFYLLQDNYRIKADDTLWTPKGCSFSTYLTAEGKGSIVDAYIGVHTDVFSYVRIYAG